MSELKPKPTEDCWSLVLQLDHSESDAKKKLDVLNQLLGRLEDISSTTAYPEILEHLLKTFRKTLDDENPEFIAENENQKKRKLILMIINRLPTDENLRQHIQDVLWTMYKLVETDNEENALQCLRVVLDWHKRYKPPYSHEIDCFIGLVKTFFCGLSHHVSRIFEPRSQIRVETMTTARLHFLLAGMYTCTPVKTERPAQSFTIIPRSSQSLKVLQDLPVILLMMHQLYKQDAKKHVSDIMKIFLEALLLKPSSDYRINRELLADFLGMQTKMLFFVVHTCSGYKELMLQHSTNLAPTILRMLRLCPPEGSVVRKEIIHHLRQLHALDWLQDGFMQHTEKFLDETVLIGPVWSVHDHFRTTAYLAAAEMAQRARDVLSPGGLARAVHLLGRHLLDPLLPGSMNASTIRALQALTDSAAHREDLNLLRRRLLMRLLEFLVLKCKAVCRQNLLRHPSRYSQKFIRHGVAGQQDASSQMEAEDSSKSQRTAQGVCTFPELYNIAKLLMGAIKSALLGCNVLKVAQGVDGENRPVLPHESALYVRLVKWALRVLAVFRQGPAQMSNSLVKEEKEAIELFASGFIHMKEKIATEVFSRTIEYFMEHFQENSSLLLIARIFLSTAPVVSVFGLVLLQHLLDQVDQMDSSTDLSEVQLKLFRFVFGSHCLCPEHSEGFLRLYLHDIVTKLLRQATIAKNPHSFLLLVRALFYSYGKWTPERLKKEFIALTSDALKELQRMHRMPQKPAISEMLVEMLLCIPARLNMIQQHVQVLMEPLAKGLRGSSLQVMQALRVLEVCVNCSKPAVLADLLAPVFVEIMHALWELMRSCEEGVARIAFRVAGKLGGESRARWADLQTLQHRDFVGQAPYVLLRFPAAKCLVNLPVSDIVLTAFHTLESASSSVYHRRQSWEVIRCYLSAAVLRTEDRRFVQMVQEQYSSAACDKLVEPSDGAMYISDNGLARNTLKTAMVAMMMAAAIKDLRDQVAPVMAAVVQRCILIAVASECACTPSTPSMDPLVLVHAVTVIMGHPEKELGRPGILAMSMMTQAAVLATGCIEKACQLYVLRHLSEEVRLLCYERTWYQKAGGLLGIRHLLAHWAPCWALRELPRSIKAVLRTLRDLDMEMSCGTVDMACSALEDMLRLHLAPADATGLDQEQSSSLQKVAGELVAHLCSTSSSVRDQAIHCLDLLAQLQACQLSTLLAPHIHRLGEVPPPRLLLMPPCLQAVALDNTTLCITNKLVTVDPVKHSSFLEVVVQLSQETGDGTVAVQRAALSTLASCHTLTSHWLTIFSVLYNALQSPALHQAASDNMKTFFEGVNSSVDCPSSLPPLLQVRSTLLPLLAALEDHRSLSLAHVRQLWHIVQHCPTFLEESMCAHVVRHLRTALLLHVTACTGEGPTRPGDTDQVVLMLLGVLATVSEPSSRLVSEASQAVLHTEQKLQLGITSSFRQPLFRLLLRSPQNVAVLFLDDRRIKDLHWNSYLEFMITHPDGHEIREAVKCYVTRLEALAAPRSTTNRSAAEHTEMQYQAVFIASVLGKYDEEWLAAQQTLIDLFKKMWYSPRYQERHRKLVDVDVRYWKEHELLARVLTIHFKHNHNDLQLLFELLRAFWGHYVCDFQFLRHFLTKTVAEQFPVSWKRAMFFRWAELLSCTAVAEELKALMVHWVLIPAFSSSLHRGEGEQLLGKPMPVITEQQDQWTENIPCVLVRKITKPGAPNGNNSDSVRVMMLQFVCLLIDEAAEHFHQPSLRRQDCLLRDLFDHVYRPVLAKGSLDSILRYHHHLVVAHIIRKFFIERSIIQQVCLSLLLACSPESHNILYQALEIIVPIIVERFNDSHQILGAMTRQVLSGESHTLAQRAHALGVVVHFSKEYYPTRHLLYSSILSTVERLASSGLGASADHRRLALGAIDTVLCWEQRHTKEEEGTALTSKQWSTMLTNLLRMSCLGNDGTSSGDVFSRRCVCMLKMALKVAPKPWGLKLSWFDTLLSSPVANNHISLLLEVIAFMAVNLDGPGVLAMFATLEKGLSACVNSTDVKVIAQVHDLLGYLFELFPGDARPKELEHVYAMLNKVVSDGLTRYDNPLSANPRCLAGALSALKTLEKSSLKYVDCYLGSLVQVLQRLLRDHLTSGPEIRKATQMLLIGLDVTKNHISAMPVDTCKGFLNSLLPSLIEKTPDRKVVSTVIKMVHEWLLNMVEQLRPSQRELVLIMLKLSYALEKRFPQDQELLVEFFDVLLGVYRDQALQRSEMTSRLEPAYLVGLRCENPCTRQSFAQLFSSSMPTELYHRLQYVFAIQNWELMGQHYWIKQVLELLLQSVCAAGPMQLQPASALLPTLLGQDDALSEATTCDLVAATVELCHVDSALADSLWVALFPQLWAALGEDQQQKLLPIMDVFVASSVHQPHSQHQPSALNTVVRSYLACQPPVAICPLYAKYLSRYHNLWYEMTLHLEHLLHDSEKEVKKKRPAGAGIDLCGPLTDMYQLMCEDDLWAAAWQNMAPSASACAAVRYLQHGQFSEARDALEDTMTQFLESQRTSESRSFTVGEAAVCNEQWIRCCCELGDWEALLASSPDAILRLRGAWRVPDWHLMKDLLSSVIHPPEAAWEVELYRGYVGLCHEEQPRGVVERHIEAATAAWLTCWRGLPLGSMRIHFRELQSAQLVLELQEAADQRYTLLQELVRHGQLPPAAAEEVNRLTSTWMARLPCLADGVAHWNNILSWRQHHYAFLIAHFEGHTEHCTRIVTCATEASVRSLVVLAKVARKQNLLQVCEAALARVYTIPTVPVAECYQQVCQRVKCMMQAATGKVELQEALELLEKTNIQYLKGKKKILSQLYGLKGILYTKIGRTEDANRTLSAALQLYDNFHKGWAIWAELMETLFLRDIGDTALGEYAITGFLMAASCDSEQKARPWIARVLWLITHDSTDMRLSHALGKFRASVPVASWLPWIPQLLGSLFHAQGSSLAELVEAVALHFPQAVFVPTRTMLLTLRREQYTQSGPQELPNPSIPVARSCQRILDRINAHSCKWFTMMEKLVENLVSLPENPCDELFRHLHQALSNCLATAFDNIATITDFVATPKLVGFVGWLVARFSIKGDALEDKRARIDPSLLKMIDDATKEYSRMPPKLLTFIQHLTSWMKMVENQGKAYPKSFLLEDKSHFLSDFSQHTAEIMLPGEFMIQKSVGQYVRVARILPRVDVVRLHRAVAHRVHLLGHNGRVYPYLLVRDSRLGECRSEERLLPLMLMLIQLLASHKETVGRGLQLAVPRVVAISPQVRLIEASFPSLTLQEVYCSQDNPVDSFYAQAAAHGVTQQLLRDYFRDLSPGVVSSSLLYSWAWDTYPSVADFWAFRERFTTQLALLGFLEYTLHLSRLDPHMLHIHLNSGSLSPLFYKFNLVDDSDSQTFAELDGNRPVPFRLTPNIQELLGPLRRTGPLTACMVAAARSLLQHANKMQALLRAALCVEIGALIRKAEKESGSIPGAASDVLGDTERSQIATMVNTAITYIVGRLNTLANSEGVDSKAGKLVAAAMSLDNLCRMDPMWYPWL